MRHAAAMTAASVDVRDMLCAQAIQVAWKAARALPVGAVLETVCNAQDVKEDLIIWARELGYQLLAEETRADEIWLWIQTGR